MIPLVATALLYLALLLILASAGFLAELAAMDWLALMALTLFSTLAGVLLYRGALRGWVRRHNHPASLRLLAGLAGSFLWFSVFVALFRGTAARYVPWGEGGSLSLLFLAGVLVLAAVLLLFGYLGRRRIGAA